MEAMNDFASARTAMVNSQVRTEDVTDYALLAAMGEVPRELFVPDRLKPFAYIDSDLAVSDDLPARYLMAPAPFAKLVQLGAHRPLGRGSRVRSHSGGPRHAIADGARHRQHRGDRRLARGRLSRRRTL